jgi:hypothetical protein
VVDSVALNFFGRKPEESDKPHTGKVDKKKAGKAQAQAPKGKAGKAQEKNKLPKDHKRDQQAADLDAEVPSKKRAKKVTAFCC